MTIFYWTMIGLIGATLVPSVFFMLLYAATGEREAARRAKGLFTATRVLVLFGFNILVWGHVIVGLWRIWFG